MLPIASAALAVAPSVSAQTAPRTGGSGSQVRPLDEELTTPRAAALGGRAEAGGASTTALFANPAGAASMRTYHVDSYGLYDPTTGRFGVGTGVMDSTRAMVSGGLAYSFHSINTAAVQRSSHDVRLVAALNMGQKAALGARLRYLNISGTPFAAQSAPESQGLQSNAWGGVTLDLGLHVHPIREFAFSITGLNLNNVDTVAAPISMGGGVMVSPIRELTFVADVLMDFRSTNAIRGRYSGGAELFIASRYAIRAGYLFDDTRGGSQAVTFGAGYLDTSFGVELSLRQAIIPDMQSTLMLSVRYFYQAAATQAAQQAQAAQTESSGENTSAR
ncbi:MAG: hypothetical protein Q8Q09_01120 [Deltaproteobacteria bacterium]|nr:hypothetical protein [Deltaproteobacteria bacterium]